METVDKARREHSITHEELVPLVGLGSGTAHRIAQGLALLEDLHQQMCMLFDLAERRGEIISNRVTATYSEKLNHALEFLYVA